jgi:hypothetical protein
LVRPGPSVGSGVVGALLGRAVGLVVLAGGGLLLVVAPELVHIVFRRVEFVGPFGGAVGVGAVLGEIGESTFFSDATTLPPKRGAYV